MAPLLIIPGALQLFFAILGVIALLLLVFLVHRLILRPALSAHANSDSPPPSEGFDFEIVLDQERTRSVSVGQLDSDIKTRMQGIKEDHLVLHFEKERGLEDYRITIVPGGAVFWRPPHSKKTEVLKASETIDSRELIGHPIALRVAAAVRDNRAIQYLEFSLSTAYFFNQFGEEKMRFNLTLSRVNPKPEINSRSKKGIYMFGRAQLDQERETEEEGEHAQ